MQDVAPRKQVPRWLRRADARHRGVALGDVKKISFESGRHSEKDQDLAGRPGSTGDVGEARKTQETNCTYAIVSKHSLGSRPSKSPQKTPCFRFFCERATDYWLYVCRL